MVDCYSPLRFFTETCFLLLQLYSRVIFHFQFLAESGSWCHFRLPLQRSLSLSPHVASIPFFLFPASLPFGSVPLFFSERKQVLFVLPLFLETSLKIVLRLQRAHVEKSHLGKMMLIMIPDGLCWEKYALVLRTGHGTCVASHTFTAVSQRLDLHMQ